jgi:hypothetical protein
MGAIRSHCNFRVALAAASLAIFQPASAPLAWAGDTQQAGLNLGLNPKLARPIPSPGWIADHRDSWPKEHAVYKETCQSEGVTEEIRYMNRIIAYDEYLINLTQSYLTGPAAKRDQAVAKQASLATATLTSLHNDIAAADSLTARLQALPRCGAATAPPAISASAAGPTPAAASPAPIPTPTAEPPAPPAAVASAASTPELVAAPPPAATTPTPGAPPRLVIRFVEGMPALTPSGIRAFDEAVTALRSGKKVRLAIDGCDAGADFSNGSACARRLLSLEEMLAENGVRDPKRALTEFR